MSFYLEAAGEFGKTRGIVEKLKKLHTLQLNCSGSFIWASSICSKELGESLEL